MIENTDNTQPATATAGTNPNRSRNRSLLIAGGTVLAVALLAGGGVAVGAAMADDNDEDRDLVTHSQPSAPSPTGVATIAGEVGAASAADLLAIIEIASAHAEGVPVDMEAIRGGGWDVQFESTSGDESEVRVQADGTAQVVSTEAADQDDRSATGQLDAATVEALVTAALGAATGTITDLSVDSDDASPYRVTVLSTDGVTVDIDLDAGFAVVGTDTDD